MVEQIEELGDWIDAIMEMHEQQHQWLKGNITNGQTVTLQTLEDGSKVQTGTCNQPRVFQAAATLATRQHVARTQTQRGTRTEMKKRRQLEADARKAPSRPALAAVHSAGNAANA